MPGGANVLLAMSFEVGMGDTEISRTKMEGRNASGYFSYEVICYA